jgi:hypothetical protein
MIPNTKKQEILSQLDSLDQQHAEQVLEYIKDMLYDQKNDLAYVNFRQNALREIKEALKG